MSRMPNDLTNDVGGPVQTPAETAFADALAAAVARTRSIACVGLDPRVNQLPPAIRDRFAEDAAAVEAFCCGVIDAVAGKVPVVKPQSAFFEALGPAGVMVLSRVIHHARSAGLLVIVDAKRNDIGSTAAAYAAAYLGRSAPFAGDALTVSPYLGRDSIEPFCEVCDLQNAGLFVLVKTSNPGGGLFQNRITDGQPLHDAVADLIEQFNASRIGRCGYGPVGSVVGATYPQQLAELRTRLKHSWILIPGYGAQGGGADDVRPGVDANGLGAIVNSSRHIIFAYHREEYRDRWAPADWQNAVAAATDDMNQQLQF